MITWITVLYWSFMVLLGLRIKEMWKSIQKKPKKERGMINWITVLYWSFMVLNLIFVLGMVVGGGIIALFGCVLS